MALGAAEAEAPRRPRLLGVGASGDRWFGLALDQVPNDGSLAALGQGLGPISGARGEGRVFAISKNLVRPRLFVAPRLVTVRGGRCLFEPSLVAIDLLRHLG